MPRHIVCLTVDFDTQSAFIARGQTSPMLLSRGEFGAMTSSRILDFLTSYAMRSIWLIPGFTMQSWPREGLDVVASGHEVGHHLWAHSPNASQTRAGRRRPISSAPTTQFAS